MNTPDTERAIDVQRYHLGLAFKSILASENPEESFVEYISSRDTYWKERVRKEVEGMKQSETHEDHCDGYCNESACYLPDRRTSNRTLDKLLDNLK